MIKQLFNYRFFPVACLALLLIVGFAIYWPGIDGPFLFDDIENIVRNDYLRLKDLSFGSLKNAAFSSESGLLNRPIPVLSFALNYFFSNKFTTAFPFKLTNVAIHCLNGLLVFWLLYLGLARLAASDKKFSALDSRRIFFLAFGTATLWTVHPIHLTSVLYIVQRMTSLSATFVLLALISYISGRNTILSGNILRGRIYIVGGTILFGLMGLFSKENAALLPIYIVIIEFTLFSCEWPWALWDKVSKRTRYLMITGFCLAGAVAMAYLIDYFYPGYSSRHFTFTERMLTEPRILLFYLSLIFLPRIDAFGIYHDDIAISINLINPWTTLFSIAFIVFLFAFAILLRKKHKLVSFAILWFFASHLMESTIIALELAHEHRNYLAVIGPAVLIMYFSYQAIQVTERKNIWWIPVIFMALFVTNTSLRAWHWSDKASLNTFEAQNHPNSARAQASMGSLLAEVGKLEEAKQAFRRASVLRPHDASDLINIHIIQSWQKIEPSEKLKLDTLARVEHGLWTALTGQVLEYAVNCVPRNCRQMQEILLTWLPIYISRSGKKSRRRAHSYYLYARVLLSKNDGQGAIAALNAATEAYKRYLHPYFLLSAIHLKRNEIEKAAVVLEQLKKANIDNPHPRGREIQALSDKIMRLRKN